MTPAELSGIKGEGDIVERWRIFGIVTAAGPSRYHVRWQNGTTERFEQGAPHLALVKPERLPAARAALGMGLAQ